ncbi:hypothetical protein DFQ27_006489 [Actinomortierella ambigua]|uniref:Sulfhydryl oxidase n=1 Tax=Actinomortierella ambigua TaxID=1343610 RepID=A0A9P6U0F0_9FUNG|nr:hypothetical protein DFQ27_006489 [Actinomortierella ambigua]
MATTVQFPRLLRLRGPLALLALCVIGLITLPSLLVLGPQESSSSSSPIGSGAADKKMSSASPSEIFVDPDLGFGGVIMPKLGNETAKATWKLIHTVASRYPEKPRPDERAAAKQWIYLLSRLYPCGECAVHFQKLLQEHPPQTASRTALSNWACSVHNLVNVRLGKPEFDCGTLFEVYKCGCADEPESSDGTGGGESTDKTLDGEEDKKETPLV